MHQPDHLRCSDIDRQVVEKLLADAYVDGRLDKEEHDERVASIWQAKTFGELREVTEDLVVPDELRPKLPAAQPDDGYPRALVDDRSVNTEPDRLMAILGTRARTEHSWRLRPHTVASAILGDVKLDLTQAVFEAQQCRIEVNVILGDVKLMVPAGVRVRDEVDSILGDVKIRGLVSEADGPEVILTGYAFMGDVKVTGPEHKTFVKRVLGN